MPALNTQPKITSSTCSGATPARWIDSRITAAPSSGAVKADRLP